MGRRAFRAVGASESLQRRLSHERPHHQDGKNREQDIQRTSKEDAVRDAEIACRSIFHDYDKNEIRAMPTSVRMAWQAGAQLVADEAAAPVSAPSVMLVDGGSWDLRGKQAMKAEERADKAERELAEIRDALAGTDYASLPSDFPTVRMAHTIRADHDKFLQQVRDTCVRAEKAETMSKSTAAETEQAESDRDAHRQAAHEGYNQDALDAASRELHMFLLREGSSYGTKACEEIGRVFMTAYRKAAP